MKRMIVISAVLLLLLIAGCSKTTVKDINDDPAGYLGKKVSVTGMVTIPLNIAQFSGFTLKDGGSSILVSSDHAPEKNSEVIVKGTVVRGIFSQQMFIYADSIDQK
ncbi:MAG: hypothetical protein V1729_06555 [Candidatus Woesearchaeota archaeon]